ncbi:chemotaxis protein CheB [Methylobacter tundripaludum]|uniref:protein-glutamate O-methyltransferase n=1 Tax=Methylobacter tundripaludum (strain ATCC BAA-1195 / DSM 17260 / SV96) TaxID=697282 RepID=G3J1J7_METTV|nr:chemotaxis protein CheB [Methylobacter tundripaludum]EGW21069.1 MCP methyltransferase/methylesterase, CheR/CheB [Methylobacter tundripaludum SV96]
MTQTKTQSTSSTSPGNQSRQNGGFPIVGLGASAGGLEAFEQFFRHIPPDSGMAFVLVSHLDPSHASILTEILQRTTSMPVAEAQDQMRVMPNRVYVIPPNRDMTIFHGALQLSIPAEPHGQRMPIDLFLRSLAEDRAEKSIGIILSGTGTDGTLGLRAILGAGGVTLAQEPTTAKFDGMPVSAIQAGYVTHILPAEKMPEVLLSGILALARQPLPSPPIASSGINHILMQLRTCTGHDFSLYKKSTITRRIQRRMSQNGIEDTETYARYLREHPAEIASLFKELLINVTSFFRDPEAFVALKQDILPAVLADKPEDYVFRVWVAGCATGEEAYSIAIVLRELMDKNQYEFKSQIYSTDLADDTITIARAGLYPPNIALDVTPERLRRFFIKEDDGYRVKKEIREMVVFAVQNVVKDPPFTKLDLLSCRNLMIYLEPELQNRLIPAFHYALKPGGVLFLSPSEGIGNHTELFTPLNRKWKFYRATPSAASTRAILTSNLNWTTEPVHKTPEDIMKSARENNLAELTRRMLLQFYAPTSVMTDLKGNILYVYGETGKYLRPAPGHATLNMIDMAREGLQLELRSAISAANQGTPTLDRELPVKTNGDVHPVHLCVRPLSNPNDRQNLLLVSFQDIAPPTPDKPARTKGTSKPNELHHIEELERELAYTKENLLATIEEQFASNEELKCTNEEMQSTNEELQSTNEELETSKEELQSINEELVTLNSELQAKIIQLADMQNDMKNLLDNIHIGTIFLDQSLIIRRFTRDAAQIYRLVASDVGCALSDIKPELEGEDDLLDAAHAVLDNLVPIEREVKTLNGNWYLARVQPYRTLENMIDGVVLTFTNITERTRAIAMQEARLLAESIVNTVREPLIVLSNTLKVVTASRSFYQSFQVTPEETVGRTIYELGGGQWNIPALRNLLETILPHNQTFEGYRVEHDFPTIGHRIMLLNARSIIGQTGEPQLILLAMDNVTDRA